uniref:Uncharacterized protein n=1 Tax=Ditylenchus dipsaci TaxID=166011 RepID=A0A915CSS6_9BILA
MEEVILILEWMPSKCKDFRLRFTILVIDLIQAHNLLKKYGKLPCGFNASAPDGGGGFARALIAEVLATMAPKEMTMQPETADLIRRRRLRGGRGGYGQRDENQSGISGYRGGFSRGGGTESYSRGGGTEGYSRGGGAEGYSRGGGAEGYGQSRGGAFRGATEGQSYRGSGEGGGRGGYSNQGSQDNRDLAAPSATSSYQPTEEEKARLAQWDATPVSKPSPFAAFKKPSVVESVPPKQPEPIVQPIVNLKVEEPLVEAATTVHDRNNNQIGAGMEIAENVVHPPVIAAVSVTIDKEVSGAVDAIATGAILNKLSKVLAGVENVVDVMKEPIPEDPVKRSTVPTPEVAVTGCASGLVRDLLEVFSFLLDGIIFTTLTLQMIW